MPTALITGSSTGIGRATARALAHAGYHLALNARSLPNLQSLQAELQARHPALQVITLPYNLTDPDQIAHMIKTTQAAFSSLDVLINNAGTAPQTTLAQLTPDLWLTILHTNLSAAVLTTAAAWPLLIQQPSTVINISSLSSVDPYPSLGIYGIAKAGLNALTRTTAQEGVAHRLRAVGIAPGAVDTPMFHNLKIPLAPHLLLSPEDVAATMLRAIADPQTFPTGQTQALYRDPTGKITLNPL